MITKTELVKLQEGLYSKDYLISETNYEILRSVLANEHEAFVEFDFSYDATEYLQNLIKYYADLGFDTYIDKTYEENEDFNEDRGVYGYLKISW